MNLLIDRICIQYEDALREGSQLSVAELLLQVAAEHREELLTELLCLRHDYAKDDVHPEQWFAEFPREKAAVQEALRRCLKLTPAELQPSDLLLNRFRIEEPVGKGAFSTVYRAWDQELGRWVAVKIPALKGAVTCEVADQVCREAKLLGSLRHHSIVLLYDVIRDENGWPLLVMEFIDGQPLDDWWNSKSHPDVPCLMQIAEAMGYAHQKGVIHRDLKPGNILVTTEGRVVLVDFGLSVQFNSQLNRRDGNGGTLKYMSPEQVLGQAHWIDGRADIWAFGVILYEMLAGEPPFAGETLDEIAQAIVERNPRPPRQTNPQICPQLEAICLRCLSKSPDGRYNTAMDLLADLKKTQSTKHLIPPRVWIVAAAVLLLMILFRLFSSGISRHAGTDSALAKNVGTDLRQKNVQQSGPAFVVAEDCPPLLAFDFDHDVGPWYAYEKAISRIEGDAFRGEGCLAVRDRVRQFDGVAFNATDQLASGRLYYIQFFARTLRHPFLLQLQLELSEPDGMSYPPIAYQMLEAQWNRIEGDILLPEHVLESRLVFRPADGVSTEPFAIDAVSIRELQIVTGSEMSPGGDFEHGAGPWKIDGDLGNVNVVQRDDASEGDHCLRVSDRASADSGAAREFQIENGRYYLCRALLKSPEQDMSIKMMSRLVDDAGVHYGMYRILNAGMDQWQQLQEVVRIDAVGSIHSFQIGVYNADDQNADYLMDDFSLQEVRFVAP
ncbi:MAG: serine/threonine protein kinase [Planctomycetaceae bacterium]|nr:serine/threonine protein kinase [Planctomycetaceae bacterium]